MNTLLPSCVLLAQATETPPASPPGFLQFVPLIVLTIPFLVLVIFMAKRKGKSVALFVILGLIPMVNMVAALWLASQTDAAVLREIDEIKKKLPS